MKQKARQKNILILENLIARGFNKTNEKELRKMGFDATAAYLHLKDKEGQKVFRYGNIGIRQSSNLEFEIFHVK
ncbi:MAG: hypothetical protein H0V01_08260 [Bacteroidetes bacterium]|nr:hypothetical protein [Bacteroidota bacterium]HET6243522.1 hypothetical protein [Bacteroidia bacterium]